MSQSRLAYIGLGSNLGSPEKQLAWAVQELRALGPLRCSSFYRTEPLGDPDQPWYLNAVVELATGLEPRELLARLKDLERKAGRADTAERWGPRVLDLDLLLLGGLVFSSPELTLPHAGFSLRRFVLEPLCELDPGVRDPRCGCTVASLLRTLDDPLRVEKHDPQNLPGPGKLSPTEVPVL
jgi:2-amino-4-hydroxy-6-hydroxymethyldihydropteridine diphosphokinase